VDRELTISCQLSIQRHYFWNLMLNGVSAAEMIEEVDVVRSYIVLVDETSMPWAEKGAVIQYKGGSNAEISLQTRTEEDIKGPYPSCAALKFQSGGPLIQYSTLFFPAIDSKHRPWTRRKFSRF
jgi:hypothetical protein